MYGAILGDIIGSPYEFDQGDKTKDFELFSEEADFTDDTVMTVAVAEALLDAGKEAPVEVIEAVVIQSMLNWGNRYPDAGYGASFINWLDEMKPEPYGSYGNGSAMRVSAVGWLYDSVERTREVARATAEVTHNHPEGIKGAESIASLIYLARTGAEKDEMKDYAIREFGYDLSRTCDEIRPTYHHVESCQETVPEAITAFLEGTDFEDVIRTAVSLGGDCDTLTAIAGSLAEAYYGVPDLFIAECNARLPDEMRVVIQHFQEQACPRTGKRAAVQEPDEQDPYAGNILVEQAIEKYYQKDTKKNLAFILYVLSERMGEDGEFLVPGDDNGQMLRLEDEDGALWLTAFTTEEQKNMGRSTSVISRPIKDFLKEALDTEEIKGVLINPWGKPFLLRKDWMRILF